jgi:hypothetical protein
MQLLATLVTPNRKPNNVIIWSRLLFPDWKLTSLFGHTLNGAEQAQQVMI